MESPRLEELTLSTKSKWITGAELVSIVAIPIGVIRPAGIGLGHDAGRVAGRKVRFLRSCFSSRYVFAPRSVRCCVISIPSVFLKVVFLACHV